MNAAVDIRARVRGLPSLSPAFARLSELRGDADAGPREYEAALKHDPGMTANLLRLANSPVFGSSREVGSVRQAVTLMGTRRIYELVASSSFVQVLPKTIPGYGITAEGFWRHSVAVAVLGEALAQEIGRDAPEMTFTAGILHDAGKLVVGTYLQEKAEALATALSEEGVTLIAAERAVLGTDHTEVGAMVAEAWRLPGPVCDVIRWHHVPDGAEVDRNLADLLHSADCLAHALSLGADVGELRRGVFEGTMERLQIDVQQLERAASRVIEQVWSLSALFGADAGS